MLGDGEATRRADREASAYSDDQILGGVARAAQTWVERCTRAGRGYDDDTRTAILVVDFEEIIELRDALEGRRTGTSPLRNELYRDLGDWLVSSEPMEPPADIAA